MVSTDWVYKLKFKTVTSGFTCGDWTFKKKRVGYCQIQFIIEEPYKSLTKHVYACVLLKIVGPKAI